MVIKILVLIHRFLLYSIFVRNFRSPLAEISSLEFRNSSLKVIKKGQEQGISLSVKTEKPQPVIYHPFMEMLKKATAMIPVRMNDKINY